MDLGIKIGDGDIIDIAEFDLHLLNSPFIGGFDIKENNIVKIDYPEKNGASIYVPTTPCYKDFEYKIQFCFVSSNIGSANIKIKNFYISMTGNKITIYNYYKKQKMVGYAIKYTEGKFYRNTKDIVIFDVTFIIPNPSACNIEDAI